MGKNKGITLIALVVTIIVLLILAGISIAMLTGENGIITRSNEARYENVRARERDEIGLAYNAAKIINEGKNKTIVDAEDLQSALREDGVQNANAAQENNKIEIVYIDSKNIYYIDENGNIIDNGIVISREGIKVGDFINYTPDTADAYQLKKEYTSYSNPSTIEQDILNWQILKIYENGKIDLIGSPTEQPIYFLGSVGYNNGVYIMNDVCKNLYSKPSKGINARSVNMEDIESWLTEEGKGARDNYVSPNSIKYGQIKTYTKTEGKEMYFPSIYEYEKGSGVNGVTLKADGIGRSEASTPEIVMPTLKGRAPLTNDIGIIITNTTWVTEVNNKYFGEGALALYNKQYWVATRATNCTTNTTWFGLRYGGSTIKGENSTVNPHIINW